MTAIRKKTLFKLLKFITAAAVFIAAAYFTGCSIPQFLTRRGYLTDIILQMIPPDFSYFPKILSPLWATVQMSVTGTFFGAVLALLIAPLCASNLGSRKWARFVLRIFVQLLRSFPALILALISTFIFGLGTCAGTFAITLYTFAIMTRLTYEDIESTNTGPYQALFSMGISPVRAYFRATVPEIAPSYLTNTLYLLETNVRHSSILGYVGAGGIGLILNEKVSWLEFSKVGIILLTLFIAVCIIEMLSAFLTKIVRGEKQIAPFGQQLIAAAIVALFVSCTITLAPPDFSHTNLHLTANMFLGFIHPDCKFFFETSSSGLFYLLLETLAISLVGTFIGAVIAAPLSFLGTSRLMPHPAALLFRMLTAAIRSVPFIIYGLIFIRVSGPGAFTGVLTLAMCSVGLLSKRFTEAIESLDFRAYRALADMGTPLILRIRHTILPQLAPVFAGAVLYRFDVNIREASVLGLVGAGGIGAPLIFAMNHYAWQQAGAIILGLVILVWIIDRISTHLRKNL